MQSGKKPRILIVVNSAAFFLSHRLPVAAAAINDGFDVHIATADEPEAGGIRQLNMPHHAIPLSRGGMNPLMELRSLISLYRLFRRIGPNVVHLVTVKPVLYGGMAARLARTPGVVAAISGLGQVFTGQGMHSLLIRGMVSRLYLWALGRRNIRVIVQNADDMKTIKQLTGLEQECFRLLPGSGVDLDAYAKKPEPDGEPIVVLASRMLFDKGIGEFVSAARSLKQKGVRARFVLVGAPDPDNPTSATTSILQGWHDEGCVEWWGYRGDIADIFARAHLVVLPSYYGEGLPKVLIEAAACGRAVITTDSPGCRDAVEPGVTGILVPVRDSTALANAIQDLLADSTRRQAMGEAGRKRAEAVFPLEKVVEAHLSIYRELLRG